MTLDFHGASWLAQLQLRWPRCPECNGLAAWQYDEATGAAVCRSCSYHVAAGEYAAAHVPSKPDVRDEQA